MLYKVTLHYTYESPGKGGSVRNMTGKRSYAVMIADTGPMPTDADAIKLALESLHKDRPTAKLIDGKSTVDIATHDVIQVG